MTGFDDETLATGETGQAGEPEHDTGTERGHAVDERHAADRMRVHAAVPAGTNGHMTVPAPTSLAPDLRDVAALAGQMSVPAPTRGHEAGTEPGHDARPSGYHGPVRIGRVPDGDILAWLREQVGTTGKVPGRRKVIDKWALGSPRADRLRRIVLDEAAAHYVAASPGCSSPTIRTGS